jgi:hypothetical protein
MRRLTAGEPIAIGDLRALVPGRFRDLVKGVVDLRRGILLVDADMHADQEAALLAEGSDPRHRQSVARLREIARAREVVADFFAGPNQYQTTAAGLQKYFDAYALAVRP